MKPTITELINKYKNTEFQWGQIDCASFAATVAFTYKGKKIPDIQKQYKYSDMKGALKWLKSLGINNFDDLHEVPEAFVGLKKKDISEVKHGDIVYYVDPGLNQGLLGICNGVRAYFLCVEGGLTARNVKECKYCWSVE